MPQIPQEAVRPALEDLLHRVEHVLDSPKDSDWLKVPMGRFNDRIVGSAMQWCGYTPLAVVRIYHLLHPPT